MENTIQAQNTEDKEDNLFLDVKNRKKVYRTRNL